MTFEVQNGCFGYRGAREILHNINMRVEKGEVLSILGPNGVGKTTLLKCTLGFLKWRKGQTLIDGKPANSFHPQELWKRVGYVPQAKRVAFSYEVEEMVLLGRNAHLGLLTQPGTEDKRIARECLQMIGMEKLRGKLCNEISGGEMQMVLVVRALAADPEILILDEPESNLDFKNQLIVLDTITELCRKRNISAIVNTHYPEHALSISDKALVLNPDGSSLFGQAREVITEQRLQKAFDVEVAIRDFLVGERNFTCVMPTGVCSA